jgi:acyl carrier protein
MSDDVIAFTVTSLAEMNFDVEDVDADTLLGPAGIDLDSLAVAELTLRIEERYGVKFGEDEMERLAIMTLGEFAAEVARQASLVTAGGPTGHARLISRDDVVAMLAATAGRGPDAAAEQLDSLALAWLVHEFERRYGIPLDPDDDVLSRMTTVSEAVHVLQSVQAQYANG